MPRSSLFYSITSGLYDFIPGIDRVDYNVVAIEWNDEFESFYRRSCNIIPELECYASDIIGYRIYRFYNDPMLSFCYWDKTYETDSVEPGGLYDDRYFYSEDIQWDDKSAVFYAVTYIDRYIEFEGWWSTPDTTIAESPRYSDVFAVVR